MKNNTDGNRLNYDTSNDCHGNSERFSSLSHVKSAGYIAYQARQ
jgi:hypothetical protein